MRSATKAILWGASSAVIIVMGALLVLRPPALGSAMSQHPQILFILIFQLLILAAVTFLATGERPNRGCIMFSLNGLSIILLVYLAFLVWVF